MCIGESASVQCYAVRVRPAQRIIADWMERTRAAKGFSWPEWARRANIKAATTLTRAVKDDYDSVTSMETIDALAKAAGVPSPLDYMAGTASAAPAGPPVNAEALKPILTELMRLAPNGGWTAQDAGRLAEAIEYGLGLAIVDPARPASSDAFAVAARAAADRFRPRASES